MSLSIQDKINLLLDKNFIKSASIKDIFNIVTDDILSEYSQSYSDDFKKIIDILISKQDLSLTYEDLQSDEIFNKKLKEIQKEINSIYDSLKKKEPPIPISKIEELNCKYEGDELYAHILLETIKKNKKNIYKEILSEGIDSFMINKITKNNNKVLSSNKLFSFVEKKDPSFIEYFKESLFDNIDPFLVGQPSNIGTRKKRKIKILGLELSLEFIMDKDKIVYIKIDNGNININESIKKINFILNKQNANTKSCDTQFKTEIEKLNEIKLEDISAENISLSNNKDIIENLNVYDSSLISNEDEPILNQDCTSPLIEDSITGDIIMTKENINEVLNEMCTQPQKDVDIESSKLENIEQQDVKKEKIEECLNSITNIHKSVKKNIHLLARWYNIKKSLEEIYYHYNIIYNFQKNLAIEWINNIGLPFLSSRELYQIANKIILYIEDIKQQNEKLKSENTKFINLKTDFLTSYYIFTDKIFLLDLNIFNISRNEMKIFIQNEIANGNYIIKYDEQLHYYPIDKAVDYLFNYECNLFLKKIINKRLEIEHLNDILNKTIKLKNEQIQILSQKTNSKIDENKLQELFKEREDDYEQEKLNISSQVYESQSLIFKEKAKRFSVRFENNNINYDSTNGQVTFNLFFITDYLNPLPYKSSKELKKISLDNNSGDIMEDILEVDIEKVKLGNEYHIKGGLLYNQGCDYLKNSSIPGFITFKNIKFGEKDIKDDFYHCINDVISTNKSKEEIINNVINKHGILYGRLIEISVSPWLFFSAEERGDNNARIMSELRPNEYNKNGEPSKHFNDFWSNYKIKWEEKYLENKNRYILPEIDSVNNAGIGLAKSLANNLPVTNRIKDIIFENYYDVKERYEQIQNLLTLSSNKIKEIEEKISSKKLKEDFNNIKCSLKEDNDDNDDKQNDCSCCGEPGSDFEKGINYLLSLPPPSDCPTIYQKCWWKQFCKDLTKIGLLPYPNGLPPIEDSTFFLGGGPSIRLGLKYWPVGYLPPSFIPIPVPNPIDGQFFIRIPLPMIWTIVDPIIIPLPFNLGIIVIFIPFIGGFMPSPLIYIKEFMNGTSFFLTGLRGFRFIPRKSDPIIKDPGESIKQLLTFGIPDKLIPLLGFAFNDPDDINRILNDIKKSFIKILDNIAPPSDISELQEIQTEEFKIKEIINKKIKEYKNKKPFIDVKEPNLDDLNLKLKNIITKRKEILIKIIKNYIKNDIPNPKSIIYPKDKDKLKIDIPGIIKSIQSILDMKSDLCPVSFKKYFNIKDEMKDVLRKIKIKTPSQYNNENKNLLNDEQIYLKINKDPQLMNKEELDNVIKNIHSAVYNIVNVIINGNKYSLDKKIKNGVFNIFELNQYQGNFTFPVNKVTNCCPPSPLNFKKNVDSEINSIKEEILNSITKTQYNIDDLSPFVRYIDNKPYLIIRVKDLKKIVSNKLGLSKRKFNDNERPLDKFPNLSKFLNKENIFNSNELITNAFNNFISSIEIPVVFPLKQDQITQTPGLGGIIQLTIPGSIIKNFVVKEANLLLENKIIEEIFPEINNIYSRKFIDLEALDIQRMIKKIILKVLDNNNFMSFLHSIQNNNIIPSRPTDFIEQILIGMGAPPPSRNIFNLMWKYFKGTPKTPLIDNIISLTELTSLLLSKIPWPITVLLGRNIINIISFLTLTDDLPSWKRMSLKNVHYVVYLDEFLRSAADISGLFKFFLGTDIIYPINEINNEITKVFNIKKY